MKNPAVRNPVLAYAAGVPTFVVAVAVLVTEFVSWTDSQDRAVIGVAAAVSVWAGSILARAKVTPVADPRLPDAAGDVG